MPYEIVRGDKIIPSGVARRTMPDASDDYPQPEQKEDIQPDDNRPQEDYSQEDYLQPETESFGYSMMKDLPRHLLRTDARIAETLGGFPGDIIQGVGNLMNLGYHALSGKSSPYLQDIDIPYVPTSEKVRKYLTKPIIETFAGKGYLDPQSKGETMADELVSDFASFLIPIKGKLPFKNALKIAGAGNLAKWATEYAGFEGPAAEAVKMGTMIGMNFASPKKLAGIKKSLFSEADTALPKIAYTNVKPLEPALKEMSLMAKRRILPEFWIERLEGINEQIIADNIPVREVVDLSQDINDIFYGIKPPAKLVREFPALKESIYGTLKGYGRKNPKFYQAFSEANDLATGIKKAEKITRFIDKHLNITNLGLAAFGSLMGFYSPRTLMKYAGGTLIGNNAYKSFQIYRHSAKARKLLGEAFKQSALGNARNLNKVAKSLNTVLEGEMPQEAGSRYEIVRG